MYIYQCLILIVSLSGFIESIPKASSEQEQKQQKEEQQQQGKLKKQQQYVSTTDISNEQPLLLLQQLLQPTQSSFFPFKKDKNFYESISNKKHLLENTNHHHQYQSNNNHSNTDSNIIQDLIQYKKQDEEKNKFFTTTPHTATTTSTTTSITIGLNRKKKSLSSTSSSSLSSSSSSSSWFGLDDSNYDDYLNTKNSNLKSSEESLFDNEQSNPNENYAYEDIIENYENTDIISSSHASFFDPNNDPNTMLGNEGNEQQQQQEQHQYNSNNKNLKDSFKDIESGSNSSDNTSSSSSRSSSSSSDSSINGNDNNKRILSNDQPYLMMNNKVKSPLPSQINKLQYTNEFYLKQGKIKGIIRTFHPQSGLRDVNQFLGIPYAEAPVGNRRFLPPGVPLPWSGLKIASHLPPVCPQNLPNPNLANVKLPKGRNDQLLRLLPYLKNENEDCLYLNVYMPQEDRFDITGKYPVIVYIHGESYEWNSGNPYDGSVLASYGQVIVVTINYRLGILGFMKPGISQTTVSNFGLFDQIAALKWIKDNIESFRGDPNRVTLMGHSTGASCVNLLMVSPVANGLFHRAILMSGSAMADWATTNHSIHMTMEIANGVNCLTTDDDEKMLKCLRSKRYKDFLRVQTALPPFVTAIGPIVDEIIIPTQPYKMMSQITETFGKYDLLFGVTELESYHILDSIALEEGLTEKERDQFLRLYMNSRYEIRPDLALAATLKQYMDVYINPSKATKFEHRDVVLDILSDARIVGPLLQTGLFHADVNPRNYMYVFGHNSEAGPYSSLPHSIVGEELPFVFGAPLAPVGPFHQKYSISEKLLSEAVMTYWTNFVKTGNPKAPWKDDFINSHRMEWAHYDIDWPEFNKRNQCYVNIGIPPSLEMKYRNFYMNFWTKELPNELNEIAAIQTKPKIHFYPPSNNGVTQRSNYNKNDEVIAGHIQKFPSNNAQNSDVSTSKTHNPIHELKMLMKEEQNHLGYDGEGSVGSSRSNNNNFNNNNNGYAPVDNMLNAQPTFGITHYKSGDSPTKDGSQIPVVNYVNEPEDIPRDILRSESALHILIGLIVLFLILNIIIYSTFLFRRKKKNSNQLNRKIGGFISYDGTNDEDLKRSKTNDGDDSYILDMIKRPNGYEYVKTKSLSINGFKITRQLSTSTVDAHTKVSDWMSNDIDKNSSVTKSSIKTSPSFSLKGRSFFRRPHKVSVGIDATPDARSDSILRQEPIEVSKYKGLDNTRSIIICQEIDVDAEMLEPEPFNGQDLVGYGYTIHNDPKNQERRCLGEPKYIRAFNQPQTYVDEQITSFIDDNRSDVNSYITKQNECGKFGDHQLTTLIEGRSYQNVILPHAIDNDDTVKRQSLPPNSFFLNRMPPAPPPRTISTLGRKPHNTICQRENSVDITTSPLALAKDCSSDEAEEPKITQNTLIVGPLLPKSQENIYSTLKKKSQPQQQSQAASQSVETKMNNQNNNDMKTIIEISTDNSLEDKKGKPSGIKPPTIYPLKNATELKEWQQSKNRMPSTQTGSNNISLLGMAKFIKTPTSDLKSKIPQLQGIESRQQKYRDKSRSADSTSSDSSSSAETVKTELKQTK